MASTTATVSNLSDFIGGLGGPRAGPSAIRAAATGSTITQPLVNDCIASIINKEDIPKRGAAIVLIGALAEATDARLMGSFDNVVSALCRAMTADTTSDLRLLPLTIRVLLEVLASGPPESGKAKGQALNKVIDLWERTRSGGFSEVLVPAVTTEVLGGVSTLLRKGTYRPNKPTTGSFMAILVPFILSEDSALLRMEACNVLLALPASKIGDIGPDTHTGVLADVLSDELNVKQKASPEHLVKVCQLVRSLLRSGKCQEVPFKKLMKFQHICTRALLLHARQRTFEVGLGRSLATQTVGLLYDICALLGVGLVSLLSTILVKRHVQPMMEGLADMPPEVASLLSSALDRLITAYPSLALIDHSLHKSALSSGPSRLLATLCRISQPGPEVLGEVAGCAMRVLLESRSDEEDLDVPTSLLYACGGLLNESGMGPAATGLLYHRRLPVPTSLKAKAPDSSSGKIGTSVCDEFTSALMVSLKRQREEEESSGEADSKKARHEEKEEAKPPTPVAVVNPFAITIGGVPADSRTKKDVVVERKVIEVASSPAPSQQVEEVHQDTPSVSSPATPAVAVIRDDEDEVPSSPSLSEDILQTPESDSDTMSDVPDLCMDPPDEDEAATE
ncbi:hypothetical protein FOZ61_009726 [Perkinsus olseni]|uniref:Uncharacterized protein n=1 Tax=Perkinsus olseni TaxID=32597 RepID=A0A7J6KYY8_PEROL|nr:hypothetical protein FOZ61_009726 [Perkinsus olseni]